MATQSFILTGILEGVADENGTPIGYQFTPASVLMYKGGPDELGEENRQEQIDKAIEERHGRPTMILDFPNAAYTTVRGMPDPAAVVFDGGPLGTKNLEWCQRAIRQASRFQDGNDIVSDIQAAVDAFLAAGG